MISIDQNVVLATSSIWNDRVCCCGWTLIHCSCLLPVLCTPKVWPPSRPKEGCVSIHLTESKVALRGKQRCVPGNDFSNYFLVAKLSPLYFLTYKIKNNSMQTGRREFIRQVVFFYCCHKLGNHTHCRLSLYKNICIKCTSCNKIALPGLDSKQKNLQLLARVK